MNLPTMPVLKDFPFTDNSATFNIDVYLLALAAWERAVRLVVEAYRDRNCD